jgi:hypothetical protein
MIFSVLSCLEKKRSTKTNTKNVLLTNIKRSGKFQTFFVKILPLKSFISSDKYLNLRENSFEKFVILNAVKDLFADCTGRRSMANNRSFTAFRMTKVFFAKTSWVVKREAHSITSTTNFPIALPFSMISCAC